MSTLSETGQFMSSTYYVRVRNFASTWLTNKSILQEAEENGLLIWKLLFNIVDPYQKNDYYHSTSKSRRSQFGLTYGSACYSYSCEMNK